jgi:glycosyltransferase involved in cell wall biosynthesis
MSLKIESHRIVTSPLQKIPHIGSFYRHLLPLMPWAIEQLDFSSYDLLISTSHCVAKGAKPAPGTRHICYCHTPMRYIWDQYDSYFGPGRASWPVQTIMKAVRPYLQRWDVESTSRVTQFLANSENVRERIQRLYKRDATVLYPPVDVDFYGAQGPKSDVRSPDLAPRTSDFYLIVSALAPYKRLDIAIETFRRLNKKLVIIGEGQNSKALREQAGPLTEFRGWCSNDELRAAYQQAKALIFPGEEDFGIVPVEAMAAGCPVIAYRKGGALETVVEGQTGLFFDAQTVDSLLSAIQVFEQQTFDPQIIRTHAADFSRQRCREAFRRLLEIS